MLTNRRVFIAEDEAATALDLELAVRDAHGEPLGVASVAEGLRALANEPEVDGAILDVHLGDEEVTPLAHVLFQRGVAVVFHTASPIPGEITSRHGAVSRCPKPMPADWVIRHLAGLMNFGNSRSDGNRRGYEPPRT